MDSPVIDGERLEKRIKQITSSWTWPFEAIVVVTGKSSEDNSDTKTLALHHFLLGIEFPETVVAILKNGTVVFLASAKKLAHLKQVERPGVELIARGTPPEAADPSQTRVLLERLKALSAGKVQIGMLLKEKQAGSWATLCLSAFRSSDALEIVECRDEISEILSIKDERELQLTEKAALSAQLFMQDAVIAKIEDVIDKDLREKNSDICSELEAEMEKTDLTKVWEKEHSLDPQDLELVYVSVQSGREFELKPTFRANDDVLPMRGCFVLSVGMKYMEYSASITRTLMVNAGSDEREAYSLSLQVFNVILDCLKPGTLFKDVYARARKHINAKKPSLLEKFVKNIGFSMGLEFKDQQLVLSEKSERAVAAGMVLCISVGFSQTGTDKPWAVWIGDTVVVLPAGSKTPCRQLTDHPKEEKTVVYELDEVEEDKATEQHETSPTLPMSTPLAATSSPQGSASQGRAPQGSAPKAKGKRQPKAADKESAQEEPTVSQEVSASRIPVGTDVPQGSASPKAKAKRKSKVVEKKITTEQSLASKEVSTFTSPETANVPHTSPKAIAKRQPKAAEKLVESSAEEKITSTGRLLASQEVPTFTTPEATNVPQGSTSPKAKVKRQLKPDEEKTSEQSLASQEVPPLTMPEAANVQQGRKSPKAKAKQQPKAGEKKTTEQSLAPQEVPPLTMPEAANVQQGSASPKANAKQQPKANEKKKTATEQVVASQEVPTLTMPEAANVPQGSASPKAKVKRQLKPDEEKTTKEQALASQKAPTPTVPQAASVPQGSASPKAKAKRQLKTDEKKTEQSLSSQAVPTSTILESSNVSHDSAWPKAKAKMKPKAEEKHNKTRQKNEGEAKKTLEKTERKTKEDKNTKKGGQRIATAANSVPGIEQGQKRRASRLEQARKEIAVQAEIEQENVKLRAAKLKELQQRFTNKRQNRQQEKESPKLSDCTAYSDSSGIPANLPSNRLYIDMTANVLVAPICGSLVPFHLRTIRNMARQKSEKFHLLRVNFFTPGQGMNHEDYPAIKGQRVYVKELSYQSSVAENFDAVVRTFKEMKKRCKPKEIALPLHGEERISLGEAQPLQTLKSFPCLRDLTLRPGRAAGTLEAHANGFRFSTKGGTEKIDVLYSHIQHLIFQPCEETSLLVIIQVHLKEAIKIRNKWSQDLQFFAECGNLTEDLNVPKADNAHDPDEILEEERERELKERLNQLFIEFAKKVQDISTCPLKFDMPVTELQFQGAPSQQNIMLCPCDRALISLREWPPFVLDLVSIDIAVFERCSPYLRTFDLAFVLKDYEEPVIRVASISVQRKEVLKAWLCKLKIPVYSRTMNMAWKEMMRSINADRQRFIDGGGWDAWLVEVEDEAEAAIGDDDDEANDYAPSDSSDDNDWEPCSEVESDLGKHEPSNGERLEINTKQANRKRDAENLAKRDGKQRPVKRQRK